MSVTSRFFKQVPLLSTAAVIGLIGIANPARADVGLCPNAAAQGGFNNSFTNVAGPLDAMCGVDSAVTMNIDNATDYAKLTFDSTVAGYPAGLTLGGLTGLTANVALDPAGDQPYYELAFTDSSNSLGQGAASDQILLIEFQAATVSGGNLSLDPNATKFNLYDNTTGVYLEGGQADTNTLAGWLSGDPALSGEALQEIRIGLGLAGGSGPAESATVNSLEVGTAAVPEPSSILLFMTLAAATVWGIQRKQQQRNRCS